MDSIAITILAGSDGVSGPAVGPASGLHPLASYKGVALRPEGRPIVAHLVERLAAVEGLGPVRVAGPARVYGELDLDAVLVDTDGSVGANLRAALEHHAGAGGGPLGLLACDVLLSVDELARLRARREEAGPCPVWFPLVRRPADPDELGAYAWKPTYRVLPEPGADPLEVLPGHLAFVEPDALRLPLLYRLLDAAYRARNRPLRVKQRTLLGALLGELLALDLRRLLHRRPPTRTARTFVDALRLTRGLRTGTIPVARVEELLTTALVREAWLHAHPGGRMRFPVLDVLALAADVDTSEEKRFLEDERGTG